MKKLGIIIVLVVLLAAGCSGKKDTYSEELYQSVPGATHGDKLYDSDKIVDPENKTDILAL